jgi:hypothetical protein
MLRLQRVNSASTSLLVCRTSIDSASTSASRRLSACSFASTSTSASRRARSAPRSAVGDVGHLWSRACSRRRGETIGEAA